MKDRIIEMVKADLEKRSQIGIEKYGTTLEGNEGNEAYWLQHLYEELLDAAGYIKKLIDIKQVKEPIK